MTLLHSKDRSLYWQKICLFIWAYITEFHDPSFVNCSYNSDGLTALHISVRNLNVQAVQALLSHSSIDVNRRDKNGYTALHYICDLKPSPEQLIKISMMIRQLLCCKNLRTNIQSKGSNIRQDHTTAKTPLELAIANENWWCVWLILAEGVDSKIPAKHSDKMLEFVKNSMSIFDERKEAENGRRRKKQEKYKGTKWPVSWFNR